jgi:hypothetical protein
LNNETLTAVPLDSSASVWPSGGDEITVRAAGTRLILDIKPLPELVAEFFRDDPRRDIGDAAGRKRQDDADGLVRVAGLRTSLMV